MQIFASDKLLGTSQRGCTPLLALVRRRESWKEMELAHTKTVEEVLEEFKVSEEEGLDNSRVEELRRKHGLNGEIPVMYVLDLTLQQLQQSSGPFAESFSCSETLHCYICTCVC